MASPDHADAGGEIPLGVAIDDETLSPTGNVLGHILYAGRRWGPHTVRHHAIERRGPADRRQVKSGILGSAIIAEAADAEVEITGCPGAKVHVVVESTRFGMRRFRTHHAQAGPQRIDREIEQVPIAKAEK